MVRARKNLPSGRCMYCKRTAEAADRKLGKSRSSGSVVVCERCVNLALARMVVLLWGDTLGVLSSRFPGHDNRIAAHARRAQSEDPPTSRRHPVKAADRRRIYDAVKRRIRRQKTPWEKLWSQTPNPYLKVSTFTIAMKYERKIRKAAG